LQTTREELAAAETADVASLSTLTQGREVELPTGPADEVATDEPLT
jgi:hypothetical protein